MLRCQPACASAIPAELDRQVDSVAEFQNHNQQNIVSNRTCQPVQELNELSLRFQLNGYENVDGLDHDLAVLDSSRGEGLYRNYIVGRVAELGSIPVKDGEN